MVVFASSFLIMILAIMGTKLVSIYVNQQSCTLRFPSVHLTSFWVARWIHLAMTR
jgi:hypothetical protein